MNPPGWPPRKRPRPKMKASKNVLVIGGRPPLDLPLRPASQAEAYAPVHSKEQLYDDPMICAFCDDGGENILSCEGICHRHFHAKSVNDVQETGCQTLGFSAKTLKSMDRFVCENCKQGMHQCFVCGELGSSNGEQREVYMCHVESCRKFYHPNCILELRGITQTTEYVKQITTGTMKLFCPRHRCDTCKTEDMSPGRLVQCRRCPRAWHIHCLKDYTSSGELSTTEVWEHGKFKYTYCRNHELLEDVRTPKRDHIKFP